MTKRAEELANNYVCINGDINDHTFNDRIRYAFHRGYSAAEKDALNSEVVRELVECLEEYIDLMDDVRSGNYTPDSFTNQSAKAALEKLNKARGL